MASIVRMPSVLAGAAEAVIANWLVAEGDRISVGDPLAEIETEKAIVEYSAEDEGILGRLVLAVGESAEIGAPIAVLIGEGESQSDIDAVLGSPGGSEDADAPDVQAGAPTASAATARDPESAAAIVESPSVPEVAQSIAAEPAGAGVRTASESGAGSERLFISPIARKLARERGIDLSVVSGTGPSGRIVRRDVEAAAAAAPAPTSTSTSQLATSQPATTGEQSDWDLVPHTGMRKAIARRLTESKSTVPHFYLVTECRVDDLLALRAQVNASSPVRISVNDFVVKAVAAAFADVPEANVTWSNEGMRAHRTVDISVAVATEGGLVTPVVRDVGAKSLSGVSSSIAELVQKAKDKRLKQDDLEGGSFSVSNLGMYGTLEFSAILNPPQSGILAVGAATTQPAVVDGELTVATVMRCTLSVDHRAVDGALAARWLASFTTHIENPLSILI